MLQIFAGCDSIPLEDLLIQFIRGLGDSTNNNNSIIALIDERLKKLKSFLPSSVLSSHSGTSEAFGLGLRLWLLWLILKGLNRCELTIEKLKYLRRLKGMKTTGKEMNEAMKILETLGKRINDTIIERKRLLQIVNSLMIKLKEPLEQYGATVS